MTEEIRKVARPIPPQAPPAAPRRGRPPGAQNKKAAPAPVMEIDDNPGEVLQRAGGRTALRRGANGKVEVLSRSGEVLSRTRLQNVDPFEVPRSMIPEGWDYQWNPVTVTGNGEVVRDMQMTMYANGWRPVPAERHAGTLIEVGAKGNIIRGGQMLEERPSALSDEARAEDLRAAKQLISDRNESLKLTKVSKEMPDGFDAKGGGVRMEIDKSLDVANLPRQELKTVDE